MEWDVEYSKDRFIENVYIIIKYLNLYSGIEGDILIPLYQVN